MPLFEVAVITKPTKKEAEEGTGQEALVVAPRFVVAKDAQSAAIKVLKAKDIPEFDLDRAEVLTRPFA